MCSKFGTQAAKPTTALRIHCLEIMDENKKSEDGLRILLMT